MNAQKGEVELKAGDRSYSLRFGWNEIAEVETLLDVSFFEGVAPKFGNPASIRAGEWRALLWSALRGGGHTDIDLLAAGEIINGVGMEELGTAIGKAVELAFPSSEAVTENPPKAGRSTGKKR